LKKLTYILAAVFSLLSTGVGVGYGKAVNRTVNPSGLEHYQAVYDGLGVPVFIAVMTPVLFLLGYGYAVGMWKKDGYWNVSIAVTVVSLAMLALFPFILQYT
jgi:hypothetical protein